MLRPSAPAVAVSDDNRCVVLHGIPWETYQLLRQDESNWRVRMTYDRGELELMAPSKYHASLAYLIGRMVDAWCDKQGLPIQGFDPLTFQRADVARGLEPDRCYYIEHEALMRGRQELDLSTDPPADLAIEVDVASSSERRMRLYETLGFPELWRYVGGHFRVYRLGADRRYMPARRSKALAGFPFELAESLLDECTTRDATSLLRSFREPVKKT